MNASFILSAAKPEQFIKSDLTEDMKNTNMLYWVGTMNSIKTQAEEIIFKELIYV